MSFGASWKSTRFVTRLFAVSLAFALFIGAGAPFDDILKKAARDNGFAPPASTHVPTDEPLVSVGQTLFESKHLSLNADIACGDCHLDKFSSADGLPNAVGIGGHGSGRQRIMEGGAIVPRNTLPLWGRGGAGFTVFFWDGKVDFSGPQPISQFGGSPPSDDPLVTAAHLPVVEIREMLAEDSFVRREKQENVESAKAVYSEVLARLRETEPEAMRGIAAAQTKDVAEIDLVDVATALAHFIRDKFRLRPTAFHEFVFGDRQLSEAAKRGGLIFYGKGKCATCHSGPYLSDFSFHSIGTTQLGFGKNGFGVDYGRYNVTHDPADLYKFRTPPLINVENTGPWGHSGSLASLEDAVIVHFDPLRLADIQNMSALDRHEFYKRLAASSPDLSQMGYLDDQEVADVVAFLKALSF